MNMPYHDPLCPCTYHEDSSEPRDQGIPETINPDLQEVIKLDLRKKEAWRWLASTKILQLEAFGVDGNYDWDDPDKLCDSLKDSVFQATRELFEASVEFKSKPWSVDPAYVNREPLIIELVDATHFIANMLVALSVTDDEWEMYYRLKQDKNRRRMASGNYSERKGGLGDGSDIE